VTGPTRGEHKLRLAVSLAGLALMGVALASHGVAHAAAMVEVVGIAGLFFGGSAVLSAWRLWKGPPG
jgi:hypothetical protein